jgi:RimJ/RimL family protein N-acetyltransferase
MVPPRAAARSPIAFRRWRADDVDAITEQWQDAELVRRFAVDAPFSADDGARFIANANDQWDRGEAAYLAIVDADDGRVLGGCDLSDLDGARDGEPVDVGYWIAAPERGRGLAGRAIGQLVEWAAAELGATRFFLEVEPDNTPSVRLAERLGFRPDGSTRRDRYRSLDRYVLDVA